MKYGSMQHLAVAGLTAAVVSGGITASSLFANMLGTEMGGMRPMAAPIFAVPQDNTNGSGDRDRPSGMMPHMAPSATVRNLPGNTDTPVPPSGSRGIMQQGQDVRTSFPSVETKPIEFPKAGTEIKVNPPFYFENSTLNGAAKGMMNGLSNASMNGLMNAPLNGALNGAFNGILNGILPPKPTPPLQNSNGVMHTAPNSMMSRAGMEKKLAKLEKAEATIDIRLEKKLALLDTRINRRKAEFEKTTDADKREYISDIIDMLEEQRDEVTEQAEDAHADLAEKIDELRSAIDEASAATAQ